MTTPAGGDQPRAASTHARDARLSRRKGVARSAAGIRELSRRLGHANARRDSRAHRRPAGLGRMARTRRAAVGCDTAADELERRRRALFSGLQQLDDYLASDAPLPDRRRSCFKLRLPTRSRTSDRSRCCGVSPDIRFAARTTESRTSCAAASARRRQRREWNSTERSIGAAIGAR